MTPAVNVALFIPFFLVVAAATVASFAAGLHAFYAAMRADIAFAGAGPFVAMVLSVPLSLVLGALVSYLRFRRLPLIQRHGLFGLMSIAFGFIMAPIVVSLLVLLLS